jgi:hypothetical protein
MTAVKEAGLFASATGPTHASRGATTPGPELTVIVPTRNEHDNVRPVYEALCRTLEGIDWEAIMRSRVISGHLPKVVCRRNHDIDSHGPQE